MLDQMLLHRLSMAASARPPVRYRPLVEAEGDHDGLEGTAMGQQGEHEGHGLRRGPQAIERGVLGGCEGLAALCTNEPLVLARVDANVTLAHLASGGTREIGAECR
ncbi:MAG TPA: hypothetical protein VES69_10470 [Pyrinomonadaceae bacterium]|nr:hypothetical protein [Pyrinomonadaceae bacterium]